MPKKKNKVTGQVLAYFRNIGSMGGRARAKKHGHKQRSTWAKMGGRPSTARGRKSKVGSALLVRKGDRTVRELAKEIGCSHAHLYDVIRSAARPGPAILSYLGMDVTHDAVGKSKAKTKNRQQITGRQMRATSVAA